MYPVAFEGFSYPLHESTILAIPKTAHDRTRKIRAIPTLLSS